MSKQVKTFNQRLCKQLKALGMFISSIIYLKSCNANTGTTIFAFYFCKGISYAFISSCWKTAFAMSCDRPLKEWKPQWNQKTINT